MVETKVKYSDQVKSCYHPFWLTTYIIIRLHKMILEENTESAVILTEKLLSNQRRLLRPMIFLLLFSASKTCPTLAMSWPSLPFSQLGDKSTEKDKVLHPNVFTGNHQVLHLFLFQVVEHLVVLFQSAIRLKMPSNFCWHGLNANKRTDGEEHWPRCCIFDV